MLQRTPGTSYVSTYLRGPAPLNTALDVHRAAVVRSSTEWRGELAAFPLNDLEVVHPACIARILQGDSLPRGGFTWALTNEIKPVDLYCYLYARFGQPNGLQNFMRNDSSDNLIHWEWTFACEEGLITIQGHNFRTEVHFTGTFKEGCFSKDEVVSAIKADFANYGKQMSLVRGELEKWVQFVNPYARIKLAVDRLQAELDALALTPELDRDKSMWDIADEPGGIDAWQERSSRYAKGVGLCFGIRSMLPVMAEAFVNLVLFVTLRSDIKSDKRLRDHEFRKPIDVRIRGLHISTEAFARPVDYSAPACAAYHSLVNDRNDLLHGNVVLEKLQFGDVYFNGNVPVFTDYHSFWDRSRGVELSAVGFDKVSEEIKVVDAFIEYVLSCMRPEVQESMRTLMASRDLGFRHATGRVGVLFPEVLVDIRAGPKREQGTSEAPDV